ncbi:hypothetical protein N489_11365 [Lactococcus lactis subsp. lactis 1AA59]|uniref:CDP-glycerol glycerophosphotransferase family protein n=1 Tax=Lactococcus lactis TaxID=1358 RepID=UPI0005382345|nr:CDP-glycerol glycerophosphotransferase family protein [Lactococcus lactis]KHE76064.1 hypothetical protein N489_11365 [Lactococcus lactis subsp. lactis 1AA59]MBS5601967.1 CDP-glycerol glycerophosphotransferase family protein [Lactococcus lactis]
MIKFKNLILLLKDIVMLFMASCFVRIKKRKDERIWLISEKYDEARDNGYEFFKYMQKEHKEIQTYYIITKDSVDLNKFNNLNNIIEYKSWKHFKYYIKSSVLISSQLLPFPTKRKICNLLEFLCLFKFKRVWLQHGIIKDKVPHKSMDYKNMKYDLLTCSTKREYNFVISEYGYPKNIAQIIGLCRYDNLFDTSKENNQILIMPTWRKWLSNKNLDGFKESSFFEYYASLLKDATFNNILEKNKIKVYLYLHYGFQNFTQAFIEEFSGNPNVIICEAAKYDVQTLLKDSNILITDYSSIFWDFAYMLKPTIYFQFDKVEYDRGHYPPAYFNYSVDAFGKVVKNITEVNLELKKIIQNNFVVEERYIKRIKHEFYYFDNSNSQRTYNKIKNLFL